MYVHRSNRTEELVGVLAGVVARPLADPLAAEIIAVQGRGMERWLSMQLAERLGVWANPQFPFPRHLIQDLLRAVLGDDALDPRFEPEALQWSIAARLPDLLARDEFEALRRYLESDTSSFRLFQLAERIAFLFDQYVVYRPDMILAWERGAETHWQAELWRALTAGQRPAHVAARARDFHDALRKRGTFPQLPARFSLFGLSTLAPTYLQILEALATHIEIHLFILSPSREFWAQTRSRRETLRSLPPERPVDDLDDVLRQEAGNPLLASLGRLGREFQEVLEATTNYQEIDRDLYVDPPATTMLGVIQGDMLALRYRSPRTNETPPLVTIETAESLHLDQAHATASRERPNGERPGAPTGRGTASSIAIHACHSPMREVEVLHDQLRHLFESEKDLEARDVIVMSPAIDDYAPLIDAVFCGVENESHRIPYRIADRRLQATDEVVHAFFGILATMGSRLAASQVVDLLELDAVRERFGIAAPQLDDIRTWIKESGIRWGIDAQHRGRAEQPEIESNTWRFGLDRLFLGYAMPGEGQRLYGGVLPYDDVEGTAAAPLGALAEFCDALFRWHRDLERPRTVRQWCDDLERVLEGMVAAAGTRAYQHQEIRGVLSDLAGYAREGGFDAEVGLETMRSCLERGLDDRAPGRSFLSGGVTFCALVPMRTVPFEVVCLLGMNDDVFPRPQRALGFDLMARKPRSGDRSARDDDRYLFLEALLSARRRLIVTYVGQSVHDNAERPPSVVVSELLDAIDESFALAPPPPAIPFGARADERQMGLFDARTHPPDPLLLEREGGEQISLSLSKRGGQGVSSRLVTTHPLQPFSPRYFSSPPTAGLVSYSRRHYEAASALVAARDHVSTPFVAAPLALAADTVRTVTIDALTRFFENPARAFLQKRLALFLGGDLETLEDREPIELNHLEQWKVGNDLVQAFLRGKDPAAVRSIAVASGRLPPGALGRHDLGQIEARAASIADAARHYRRGDMLPILDVDTMLGDTRLTGFVRDRWPAGYSQYQYSKLGGRRELGVWVRHLVINLLAADGEPRESWLVGRDGDEAAVVRFTAVGDAASVLQTLLDLYWYGMTSPLPLFQYASRKYVEVLRKREDRAAALEAAIKLYDGGERARGDVEDDYVEQAFRNRRPVRDDEESAGAPAGVPARFSAVALAVYGSFLDHYEVLK